MPSVQTYGPEDPFFSGYAGETAQDIDYLRSFALDMPFTSGDISMPDTIDPRNDEKFLEGWMRVESQGGVGACAGYGLISTLEYVVGVLTGEVIQLSPMYAYLMSQMFDGIKGDRGATLTGCTKLAAQGLVLLSDYPLERKYPSGGYKAIPKAVIEKSKTGAFRSMRAVKFRDAPEYRAFCGSYAGIAQTGTRWTREMANPGTHGVVTSVSDSSFGGHSWTFCGYTKIDLLGAEARRFIPRTRSDSINIATNSHDTQYGDQGFAYYTDELFNELNRNDLILGRTDMPNIEPRASKIDFSNPKNSRYSPYSRYV